MPVKSYERGEVIGESKVLDKAESSGSISFRENRVENALLNPATSQLGLQKQADELREDNTFLMKDIKLQREEITRLRKEIAALASENASDDVHLEETGIALPAP